MKNNQTTEELEIKIALFLRYGVFIAGFVMFAGWAMNFKFSGDPYFGFSTYDQIPLRDLVEYYIRRKNWGALVSYSGLAMLISLPLIRVLLTMILFLKQKEHTLAGVAFIVFAGLMLSLFLGIEL